jgi:hypothetical protein
MLPAWFFLLCLPRVVVPINVAEPRQLSEFALFRTPRHDQRLAQCQTYAQPLQGVAIALSYWLSAINGPAGPVTTIGNSGPEIILQIVKFYTGFSNSYCEKHNQAQFVKDPGSVECLGASVGVSPPVIRNGAIIAM